MFYFNDERVVNYSLIYKLLFLSQFIKQHQLNFQMIGQTELENLEKLRILGQGTYGKCYLVHNKQTDELCVLKQIEIFGMSPQQQEQVQRQAKILSVLDHPTIVKFLNFFKTQSYLNIVMEYADGGDLNKLIKEAKGVLFTENQILNWFTQICLSIKHIHDRKIIHRDLKCQNIFMTKDGRIKLGDFGIARHLSRTLDKIKTVVGTPYYMSPEICENKDYSFKTDIWSLGVILYEMCAQKLPFDGNSLPVLALKISRGEYTQLTGNNYSKDLKRLITSLLQSNPIRRPSINKILQNPLIEKRINKYLPKSVIARQFSHTTLHSHNIFQKQNDTDNFQQENTNVCNNLSCNVNNLCYGQKINSNKVISFSCIPDQLPVEEKLQINSARNAANHKGGNKTPQAKNLDFGSKFSVGSINQKQLKEKEKKKKMQAFKRREISEPNLIPKKQIGNNSLSVATIQQTSRRSETIQTLEQTLQQILTENYGDSMNEMLDKIDQHQGIIEENTRNGLLTLFWGFQKFNSLK